MKKIFQKNVMKHKPKVIVESIPTVHVLMENSIKSVEFDITAKENDLSEDSQNETQIIMTSTESKKKNKKAKATNASTETIIDKNE